MASVDAASRKALADVIGPLIENCGGAQTVADLVGVHKTRVYAWMKGDIPIDRIGALASKLGRDITVHFPAGGGVEITEEAAPPVWAERLLAGVMALETDAEITPDELVEAEAKAAAFLAVARRKRPGQGGGAGGSGSVS